MLLTKENFRDLLRLLVDVGGYTLTEANKVIEDAAKDKDYAVRAIEKTIRLTSKTKRGK